MKLRFQSVLLTLLALGLAPAAAARVPTQIDAQGVLRDGAGDLVDLPDATIVFRMYDAATAGNLVWSETQSVPVVLGVFDALLPQSALTELPTPVQTRLATGAPLWLSVQLSGQAELPRTPLVSVPYAFTADRALSANDLACSGCIDASDINASTFTAQHLVYAPSAGDLVTATTVGGAIGQLDRDLADHIANPNGHHAADSSGIAIKPTSVTIGATKLTDGALDLGAGANDSLTAAQVTTLTAGGNADALHSHTAASISGLPSGGSCFSFFGSAQPTCPSGYTIAQTGIAVAPQVVNNGGTNQGVGGAICANVQTNQGGMYLQWIGAYNGNTGVFASNLLCSVCCPVSQSTLAIGCVSSFSGQTAVIIPYYAGQSAIGSTTARSKGFPIANTYTNRTYHVSRFDIAAYNLSTGTSGSATKYDLRLLDASQAELGRWQLVNTGTQTSTADFTYYCSGSALCQTNFQVLSAAVDLDYSGNTNLYVEVIDVTNSTAQTGYIINSDCVNGACTPWHKVTGCTK